MHYKNSFYDNNKNRLIQIFSNIFYGHRLNYKNDKVKKIIFMNDRLANISSILSVVCKMNKEKKIFDYIEELRSYPQAINFFNELFRRYQKLF